MKNKKIEQFIIENTNMTPDKVVYSYLVKILEHFEEGGKIRGALNRVSKVNGSAYQALFRYIQDVVGTPKYEELTGTKYPVSPNEFLTIIYKKYFLE